MRALRGPSGTCIASSSIKISHATSPPPQTAANPSPGNCCPRDRAISTLLPALETLSHMALATSLQAHQGVQASLVVCRENLQGSWFEGSQTRGLREICCLFATVARATAGLRMES